MSVASSSRTVVRSIANASLQAPKSRAISGTSSSPIVRPATFCTTRCEVPVPPAATARSNRTGQLTQRRGFFSLPDIHKLAGLVTPNSDEVKEGRGIEMDGELQRFHSRKILPYSQAQLYALVSDVPSYSSFIPFCTSSRVLAPHSSPSASTSSADSADSSPSPSSSRHRQTQEWKPDNNPFDLEAELKVGFGGLEETYVSRVLGRPFESVTATAAKQSPLFKSLKTTWSFSPASPLSPHSSAASTPSSPSPDSGRVPNSTAPTSPDDGPTLLNIDLTFSFANPLHRIASQAVLPKVAEKMVEAFEKRCLEVFGKGTA